MDIKIKSRFKFDENLYDKAFGLAKSILINDKQSAIKHIGSYTLTAKRTPNSVYVRIQRNQE